MTGYTKSYTAWQDFPNVTTPATAAKLQNMDDGIANSTLYFNVRSYGAAGDGTTNDAAAIQAAIDAAELLVSAGSYAPIVYFPPGKYAITSTITWKSAHLVGAYPNNSTQILWNGTSNTGPMIAKGAGAAGGMSFALMADLMIGQGTTQSSTILDLTATADVDAMGILSRVHFNTCLSDAINMNGWTNLRWPGLRFDGVGGYAIRATVGAGQTNTSFVCPQCVYATTIGGKGVMCIDNTAGSPNLGLVAFTDGRWEINTTAWTSNKAIFNLILPDVAPPSGSVTPILDRIEVSTSAGLSGNRVLYRQTASTAGTEKLVLNNCEFTTPGDWTSIGGTLSTSQLVPPIASGYTNASVHTDGVLSHLLTLLGGASGTDYPIRILRSGESQPRWRNDNAGIQEWGDGTNPPDTNLFRQGANILRTNDKLTADLGFGVGNSASATSAGAIVKKIEVFSETGASLGYLPVYNTIT